VCSVAVPCGCGIVGDCNVRTTLPPFGPFSNALFGAKEKGERKQKKWEEKDRKITKPALFDCLDAAAPRYSPGGSSRGNSTTLWRTAAVVVSSTT
jgi:hypothetical protein